jgi:hypothetical protein
MFCFLVVFGWFLDGFWMVFGWFLDGKIEVFI